MPSMPFAALLYPVCRTVRAALATRQSKYVSVKFSDPFTSKRTICAPSINGLKMLNGEADTCVLM